MANYEDLYMQSIAWGVFHYKMD